MNNEMKIVKKEGATPLFFPQDLKKMKFSFFPGPQTGETPKDD
jgi:hypothetical protein